MGGLGNQMFQYAAAKALSHYHNLPIKVDLSFLKDTSLKADVTQRVFELECFTAKIEFTSNGEIEVFDKSPLVKERFLELLGVRRKGIYLEKSFNFDTGFYSIRPNSLLVGYWQSEKYFAQFRSLILEEFSWRNPLVGLNSEAYERIINSNAVSIHIRRGDYVTNSSAKEYHGICEIEYYRSAMALIESKVDYPKYFVFSDDLAAAKAVLGDIDGAEFIDWNSFGDSFQDMRLMSCCKHNIIANSSFSWWGAWLNNNPKKIVVAPKKWFNKSDIDTSDLIPESWKLL
jgi:hypothetical protein